MTGVNTFTFSVSFLLEYHYISTCKKRNMLAIYLYTLSVGKKRPFKTHTLRKTLPFLWWQTHSYKEKDKHSIYIGNRIRNIIYSHILKWYINIFEIYGEMNIFRESFCKDPQIFYCARRQRNSSFVISNFYSNFFWVLLKKKCTSDDSNISGILWYHRKNEWILIMRIYIKYCMTFLPLLITKTK